MKSNELCNILASRQ